MARKIRDFFKKHESKIILAVGLILVSVVSFETGILKGRELKENPIVIETSAQQPAVAENATAQKENPAQNSVPENEKSSLGESVQNCAFVGSKNSNKYHLPSCRWAKQIKPENIVCFKDENEAKSKGYLPDSNCIK